MNSNSTSLTPYEVIMTQYDSLTQNLELFKALSDNIKKSSLFNETLSLHELASVLIKSFIKNFPDGSCNYFSNMHDVIIYEWLLELYLLVEKSSPSTNAPITATSIARIYAEKSSTKGKQDSIAQMFSRNNTDMQAEFNMIPFENSPKLSKYINYRKYTTYKEFLHSNSNREFLCNILSPLDTFFYTQFHSRSPFSLDNIDTGITYKNLFNIISEYRVLHINDPEGSIASELSAYYFEKMHHSISYSMCMNTLLNTKNFSEDLLKDHWLLYTFAKQFDTHNLSLIIFTQNTFLQSDAFFTSPEDEASLNFHAYFHFQINQAFYLPALFCIFASLVHQKFSGNLIQIREACKQYIKDNCSKEYSYRSSLNNTFNQIVDLSNKLKQTKSAENTLKESVLFCTSKNDSKHYKFNMLLFKFFYKQECPCLFSSYTEPQSCLTTLKLSNDQSTVETFFVHYYPQTTEQLITSLYSTLRDNYALVRSLFLPQE